ncbi:MAG: hypothetical protein U0V87_03065 [Acidobacteriota bacterium]
MNAVDFFYGLYRRTPVALQNFMVGTYGYVLKKRRYGDEHDRTLQFLMETMRWERERLDALALSRLQDTLQYAQTWVPYYREQWAALGFDPRDVKRVEDIRQLPILEKDALKDDPTRFASQEYDVAKLFSGNTSGTTGKPVTTFKDKGCYQRVWAYQERQRRIWGLGGERARVSIGVRPIVPMDERKPPFWRHDWSEDDWLFSNFHISEETLDAYVDKIVEINPEEINAYPSGIYLIAAHALAARRDDASDPRPSSPAPRRCTSSRGARWSRRSTARSPISTVPPKWCSGLHSARTAPTTSRPSSA